MGDGLTTFRIPTTNKAVTALVENNADGGAIVADGGRIQLLARSMNPGEVVVNQGGVLQARSLTAARGGEILLGALDSAPNAIRLGGTVDVTGTDAGVAGGTVRVVADRLQVAGARIDASGNSGGDVALSEVNGLCAVTFIGCADLVTIRSALEFPEHQWPG